MLRFILFDLMAIQQLHQRKGDKIPALFTGWKESIVVLLVNKANSTVIAKIKSEKRYSQAQCKPCT